jgi:DNA-directed RNA polymerase specialized sigma24 family protein
MEALGELPEKKQTLLRKHYFEDKTVAEIAEEMGLSLCAMRARLQTRKGALKRQYRKKIRT